MQEIDELTPDPIPLSGAQARCLLRHLRDLNLTSERVEIGSEHTVYVEGCLSLDSPIERMLLYRLRTPEEGELSLVIRWDGDALLLSLVPPSGGPAERERKIALFSHDERWVTAPELRARVDPESNEPRQLEHFMRRLVRGVYAA